MYCIWKKVQTVSSISNVIIFSSFLGKLYFDCIMSEEDFLDSAKDYNVLHEREGSFLFANTNLRLRNHPSKSPLRLSQTNQRE